MVTLNDLNENLSNGSNQQIKLLNRRKIYTCSMYLALEAINKASFDGGSQNSIVIYWISC